MNSNMGTGRAGVIAAAAGLAVKLGFGWLAVNAWTGTATPAGIAVTTVLALLCWGFVRQAVRYTLAVGAMAVVRALTVRAGALADPGRVTDPDAAWRVWLEVRCAGCGH